MEIGLIDLPKYRGKCPVSYGPIPYHHQMLQSSVSKTTCLTRPNSMHLRWSRAFPSHVPSHNRLKLVLMEPSYFYRNLYARTKWKFQILVLISFLQIEVELSSRLLYAMVFHVVSTIFLQLYFYALALNFMRHPRFIPQAVYSPADLPKKKGIISKF